MNNKVISLEDMKRQVQEFSGLTREPDAPHIGGRPPGGDGMEPRIAKLEAQMEAARADLGDLKRDMGGLRAEVGDIKVVLARIETALTSKIDYKWLTIYVMGIVALILREEIAALFK